MMMMTYFCLNRYISIDVITSPIEMDKPSLRIFASFTSNKISYEFHVAISNYPIFILLITSTNNSRRGQETKLFPIGGRIFQTVVLFYKSKDINMNQFSALVNQRNFCMAFLFKLTDHISTICCSYATLPCTFKTNHQMPMHIQGRYSDPLGLYGFSGPYQCTLLFRASLMYSFLLYNLQSSLLKGVVFYFFLECNALVSSACIGYLSKYRSPIGQLGDTPKGRALCKRNGTIVILQGSTTKKSSIRFNWARRIIDEIRGFRIKTKYLSNNHLVSSSHKYDNLNHHQLFFYLHFFFAQSNKVFINT